MIFYRAMSWGLTAQTQMLLGGMGIKKRLLKKFLEVIWSTQDDPMSWYDEKTNRVEYKKNFIGKINGTSFYGNNQLALLEIYGSS